MKMEYVSNLALPHEIAIPTKALGYGVQVSQIQERDPLDPAEVHMLVENI